jgi:hypothetical protein
MPASLLEKDMSRKILMLVFAITIVLILSRFLMGGVDNPEEKFALFNKDQSSVTDEICAEIQDNPTHEGVATAREILRQAQPFLQKELNDIKAVDESRVTFATLMEFRSNIKKNRNKLKALLKIDAVNKAMKKDERFRNAMMELSKEYKSITLGIHDNRSENAGR